ncbi:hypothetical protein [Streptomyces hoynatensis]|uniref:Uncharacterized protein n=1 Tax=Streptomyces hoynatensis TaxID=1141874 RepID=A0A3A9ZCI5_9ACTN|nr:hypothetical protein [Streptomyces hoynatensis]RKN45895.1 hypothetical protein D7294_05525 [Streptomyces hoynatensis]
MGEHGSRAEAKTGGTGHGPGLLGVYLNDHLAGATGGLRLARRMTGPRASAEPGPELREIAAEIAEDRAALLGIMRRLDVPVRRYKAYAGGAAELAGRLKPNGRLLRRSPLAGLVELEALRLGVTGKAEAWSVLRELAASDARLDSRLLDELLARALRQGETLDRLRAERARELFAPA